MGRDNFLAERLTTVDPIVSAAAVTPNDSTDLSYVTRAFMVNAGGDIKVAMLTGGEGDSSVIVTCLAGIVYPFRVTRIYATGTTATGITALW